MNKMPELQSIANNIKEMLDERSAIFKEFEKFLKSNPIPPFEAVNPEGINFYTDFKIKWDGTRLSMMVDDLKVYRPIIECRIEDRNSAWKNWNWVIDTTIEYMKSVYNKMNE